MKLFAIYVSDLSPWFDPKQLGPVYVTEAKTAEDAVNNFYTTVAVPNRYLTPKGDFFALEY